MKWKLEKLLSRMRQSVLASFLFGAFFFVPAMMVSPANISHPLWIVAICLCVTAAIRAVTHDFGAAKNPDLVKNPVWGSFLVFASLQFLAGLLILVSIIYEGLNPLWIALVIVFAHFGRKNVTEIGYSLARKKSERKRAKARAQPGTVEYEQEEASAKSEAERRWNRE